jgi:biotin-(acetyl-CoA carboxylase) ligase
MILGIGLNVNFDPEVDPALRGSATGLSVALGREIDREALTSALFRYVDLWYRDVTDSPDVLRAAWISRLRMLGASVVIQDALGTRQEIAESVQPDGGLVVRAADGTRRTVYAADVSLRRHGGDSPGGFR